MKKALNFISTPKEQLINELLNSIMVINARLNKYPKKIFNNEDLLIKNLNLTKFQLKEIISYIVEFLPNKLYLEKYKNIYEHFQEKFLQYFILFIIQEDIKHPTFKNSLINFKDEILSYLLNNTFIYKNK